MDNDKTLWDVFSTLTEEQKELLYIIVGSASKDRLSVEDVKMIFSMAAEDHVKGGKL